MFWAAVWQIFAGCAAWQALYKLLQFGKLVTVWQALQVIAVWQACYSLESFAGLWKFVAVFWLCSLVRLLLGAFVYSLAMILVMQVGSFW